MRSKLVPYNFQGWHRLCKCRRHNIQHLEGRLPEGFDCLVKPGRSRRPRPLMAGHSRSQQEDVRHHCVSQSQQGDVRPRCQQVFDRLVKLGLAMAGHFDFLVKLGPATVVRAGHGRQGRSWQPLLVTACLGRLKRGDVRPRPPSL